MRPRRASRPRDVAPIAHTFWRLTRRRPVELLEIACDESGYEGENLIGGSTDVFAHASVRLRAEAAAACIREIHRRIQSPVQEYKSTHLLRGKHRPVLERVALYQDQRPSAIAERLAQEGPRAFGRVRWERFLKSFTDLLRPRNRRGPRAPVDSFFAMVDLLRLAAPSGRVGELMGLLCRARPRADALRAQLVENPRSIPALDLLFPAIVQAVAYWSDHGRPVAITHDQHSALTADRVAQKPTGLDFPAVKWSGPRASSAGCCMRTRSGRHPPRPRRPR